MTTIFGNMPTEPPKKPAAPQRRRKTTTELFTEWDMKQARSTMANLFRDREQFRKENQVNSATVTFTQPGFERFI